LGRTGTSMPTDAQLDFQYTHAQARDAVHLPFDNLGLSAQLVEYGRDSLSLHSAASDRHSYLQRPDLGRRLNDESAHLLSQHRADNPAGYDLAIVIADGWSLSPVALVSQGRVAVADEVAERLGAHMVVVLIGERPDRRLPQLHL